MYPAQKTSSSSSSNQQQSQQEGKRSAVQPGQPGSVAAAIGGGSGSNHSNNNQVHHYQPNQYPHHHSGHQQPAAPPQPPPPISQSSAATAYPSQQQSSNTLLNTILPIMNVLVNRYRSSSGSMASSVTSAYFSGSAATPSASHSSSVNMANLEACVDDLKNSFIYLEQHNPGACDLFLKKVFFKLKEFEKCTATSSNN